MNGNQEVTRAVAGIQRIGSATLTELSGVQNAVGDLDELLGILSHLTRQLSSAAENLPGNSPTLQVDESEGSVTPGFVCNRVAKHLQAAAVGIDQARKAVSVVHRLSLGLHTDGR